MQTVTKKSAMESPPLEAGIGEGARYRFCGGPRHARGASREAPDRAHARRGGHPPEGARLQRSGRTKRAPVPHVSRQVLGPVSVDARADHGLVGSAREILGSRGGGRAAGRQRGVEFYAGASGRRRRGNAAAPVASQCARPARVELAGHSRPGTGPGRYHPRAPGRHHSRGREAPDRSDDHIDQSALTGESKDADKAPGEVLSSGSVVRRGEGNGVVF